MLTIVLGVAIGLVLVFMLFSLFLAAALEAVAALMKLRGRALRVAIARLIEDPAHPPGRGFGLVDEHMVRRRRPGIGPTPAAAPAGADGTGETLVADEVDAQAPELYEAPTESSRGDLVPSKALSFAAVFSHPLVAGAQAKCTPSYVPAANFSTALLHVLRNDAGATSLDAIGDRIAALPPGQLRDALETAVQEAQDDLGRFKASVERWYEHAMDRLSGEYKRFSQAATFIVGLALAVVYNIDAIAIGQRLYVDDALRAALVQQATKYIEDAAAARPGGSSAPGGSAVSGAAGDAGANAAGRAAPGANLPASAPTGATATDTAPTAADPALADFKDKLEAVREARERLLQAAPNTTGEAWRFSPSSLIGWLVTALAGMLGAPFWFDLLQKLVSLRGTGPKPMPVTPKAQEVQ